MREESKGRNLVLCKDWVQRSFSRGELNKRTKDSTKLNPSNNFNLKTQVLSHCCAKAISETLANQSVWKHDRQDE